MSKPRKRRVIGKVLHQGLIKRMFDADCSPADLAAELGLTLADLAQWASDPRNLAALESLARLADIRAQMVVSRYRAHAAGQLIQIGTSSTQSDLARKACVDLLNADLHPFAPPSSIDSSASSNALKAEDPNAIAAALERLGQSALDQLHGCEPSSTDQQPATSPPAPGVKPSLTPVQSTS